MELLRLAVMPLHDAKELQRILAQKNLSIELNHNGQTCSRGCTVTVEVLGTIETVPAIQEIMKEQYQKWSEGLDIKWELLEATFDPAQTTATCPACGTQFQTTSSECPECGLCF
jgi:rubrerythrin